MKKDFVVAAVSVLLIVAVTFGLAALSRDLPLTPSQPFVPGEKGSAARKVAADDKVVMRVNGEPIT